MQWKLVYNLNDKKIRKETENLVVDKDLVFNLLWDAIWFTGGLLIFGGVYKYKKFDKKTFYTGENVLKMGCIKCFSI